MIRFDLSGHFQDARSRTEVPDSWAYDVLVGVSETDEVLSGVPAHEINDGS